MVPAPVVSTEREPKMATAATLQVPMAAVAVMVQRRWECQRQLHKRDHHRLGFLYHHHQHHLQQHPLARPPTSLLHALCKLLARGSPWGLTQALVRAQVVSPLSSALVLRTLLWPSSYRASLAIQTTSASWLRFSVSCSSQPLSMATCQYLAVFLASSADSSFS